MNRWRSERCERTFAHVCETGGGRRTWLLGLSNTSKVHTIRCAAYNLGLLLRKVWGMRKPRNAGEGKAGWILLVLSVMLLSAVGVSQSRIGVVLALEILAVAVVITRKGALLRELPQVFMKSPVL